MARFARAPLDFGSRMTSRAARNEARPDVRQHVEPLNASAPILSKGKGCKPNDDTL